VIENTKERRERVLDNAAEEYLACHCAKERNNPLPGVKTRVKFRGNDMLFHGRDRMFEVTKAEGKK
jgi:hypothetical protein